MNYNGLQEELQRSLGSQTMCEGDGNLDQRVDQRDADGVSSFSSAVSPLTLKSGGQSYFDLNTDALTNDTDAQIVAANLGTDCIGACRRSDLNHDGYVNEADVGDARAGVRPLRAVRGRSQRRRPGRRRRPRDPRRAARLQHADADADAAAHAAHADAVRHAHADSLQQAVRARRDRSAMRLRAVRPRRDDAAARQRRRAARRCARSTPPACAARPRSSSDTPATRPCARRHDVGLATQACYGIQACDVSEILKAERAAGCSCCASQLCGCTPSATTNGQVRALDAEQRQRGETPQCDINGTLCGQ